MKEFVKEQLRRPHSKKYLSPVSHLFKSFYAGRGCIVMLHRILSDEEALCCDDIEVNKSYLIYLIDYFLAAGYQVVSLDEACDLMKKTHLPKKKFVVFTFDDGYRDNYTRAYPIFKQYNLPFTIYVTTCFPDQTAKLWWYALKDLMDNPSLLTFDFEGHTYHFDTQTKKREAYYQIRDLILSADDSKLDDVLHAIFDGSGIRLEEYVKKLAMNWEQIIELAQDDLVTIGAHTVNHYNLKQLSQEGLEKEIKGSVEKIEQMIGKEVSHFAYPFGSKQEASLREFKAVQMLGLKTGTTTRLGTVFTKHADHMSSLPRINVNPHNESPFPEYYASGMIPALRNKLKRVITD